MTTIESGLGSKPVDEFEVDLRDPLRLWAPEPLSSTLETFHVSPYSELGDRAEQFAYEQYRERGFCRESPRRWIEETDRWRDGSTLHVICEGDEVLGVLRTIVGRFDELPVSQFEPIDTMHEGTFLDGGSLAVKADHRGLGLATELYRHWVEIGVRNHVRGFCLLMDDGLVDFLHTMFALETHPFAQRRDYMGGDIEPLVVWMPQMLHHMARVRPELYKFATKGFTPQEIVDFDLPIVLT